MKRLTTHILVLASAGLLAQDMTTNLYDTYDTYKETQLTHRRFKYAALQPLIANFKGKALFEVNRVGRSIEGRDLTLISIGQGSENIFLWSQMHGDEPTATSAIFDMLNFFDGKGFEKEKAVILSKLKLHFLPMLNPDGAERYQRRNALGIDINRDALRLQSPEGRTLKRVRDSLNASFGFNLHDQSTYYNAEQTDKPATMSYLATAYNYEKDINEIRAKAMKVIVFMNGIIQKYAPGQVGRYNDTFEPRAFGDNIAKWGTSLILIESGGNTNDIEKQEIRKLNYVSMLSALYTIATKSFEGISLEDYEKIPRNDRKLFDLKIKNVTYILNGEDYLLDLGINRTEIDTDDYNSFYYKSSIVDQGDLSTYYGYETFDAAGYTIVPPKLSEGKPEPKILAESFWNRLQKGYAYQQLTSEENRTSEENPLPIHFWNTGKRLPDFDLRPEVNPTFFLQKEGKLTHAVINGFILDLSKPFEEQVFGNALIYR